MRLAFIVLLALAGIAHAEPRRFALLIGAASGEPNEERLRFAEADAERIATTLRDVGDFASEDVVVLATPTAAEVRRALIRVNARVREAGGDSLLFVFYSGHADAEALQLAGTRFPTSELRDLVYGSAATARVLVIDACRSGSVTRLKGGHRGPAFAISLDEQIRSKGVAILTSSAAGEDSQESDDLRASFFTHYLASGLRGAADADGDSRVSLVEAFTYAAERTLTATARTVAGPQHPTYRYDLTGREDLILTRLARNQRIGTLVFSDRGAYFVQQRDASGTPVAEVEITGAARALALPAGDYFLTLRASDHLRQGRVTVEPSQATAVRAGAMTRIAYAQVVRKGGTRLHRSASVFGAPEYRRGYAGAGLGFVAGARLDLRAASFELRVHGTWFGTLNPNSTPRGTRPLESIHEYGVSVHGLRVLDTQLATLGAGLALGGVRAHHRAALFEPLDDTGLSAGLVAQAERTLLGPVHARLELGMLGYVFPAAPLHPDATFDTFGVWTASLGLGAYF